MVPLILVLEFVPPVAVIPVISGLQFPTVIVKYPFAHDCNLSEYHALSRVFVD